MQLQPVTGVAFSVVCVGCKDYGMAGSNGYRDFAGRPVIPEQWFADLDGEPFKAYYCAVCASKIAQNSNDELTRQMDAGETKEPEK